MAYTRDYRSPHSCVASPLPPNTHLHMHTNTHMHTPGVWPVIWMADVAAGAPRIGGLMALPRIPGVDCKWRQSGKTSIHQKLELGRVLRRWWQQCAAIQQLRGGGFTPPPPHTHMHPPY